MEPHGKLVHSRYGLRMCYDGLLEDYAYGGVGVAGAAPRYG